MIGAAASHDDFAVVADIYAEVPPDGRITAEQAACSPGVTLLHGDVGSAYITASSVPGAALVMSDTGSRRFAAARGLAEITRDVEVMLTVAPCVWPAGVVELADEHLKGAYAVCAEAAPEVALPQIAAAPPFEEWLAKERRQLAAAMKRAEIAWASDHGYTEIVTDMVEGNAGMRAVNERLGYVERPAWIVVEGPA